MGMGAGARQYQTDKLWDALTPVLCKWALQALREDAVFNLAAQTTCHNLFHNLIAPLQGELSNTGDCQCYHSKEKLG